MLWLLGAFLSIIGSVLSNLGVNTQKYSFMQNEKLPVDQRVPAAKQKLWLVGLGGVILGSLGDFAVLGLAPQSVVTPIGSTTLVANLFFAHYWLKEELSKKDIFGTVMIIVGATTAVASGNHEDATYTMDQLKEYYGEPLFVAYAVVLAAFALALLLMLRQIEPLHQRMADIVINFDKCKSERNEIVDNGSSQQNATKLASLQKQMDALDEELAAVEVEYSTYEKAHPFSYCALSGVCGAQSILFGKMVAEMLSNTFGGQNEFKQPLFYVFLLCMLGSIFLQLKFLAQALNLFDALYVVPVFQCFFISVSTIGGGAYYKEFNSFGAVQWVFFPIGIIMTLYGVYVLSSRDMTKKKGLADADEAGDGGGMVKSDDITLTPQTPSPDDTGAGTISTMELGLGGRQGSKTRRRSTYARDGVLPFKKMSLVAPNDSIDRKESVSLRMPSRVSSLAARKQSRMSIFSPATALSIRQ